MHSTGILIPLRILVVQQAKIGAAAGQRKAG